MQLREPNNLCMGTRNHRGVHRHVVYLGAVGVLAIFGLGIMSRSKLPEPIDLSRYSLAAQAAGEADMMHDALLAEVLRAQLDLRDPAASSLVELDQADRAVRRPRSARRCPTTRWCSTRSGRPRPRWAAT